MLRGENVICGTSTTGTGTLTLAATATPPGGVDFDVFARTTGIGFGNSAVVLVSYTIIEYTSSAFTTAKSQEKGIGTLTLGSSSGIANCTLARTTVQQKSTSLDSQPAAYTVSAPTAISIGTAANTLVFIAANASEVPAFSPYFDATGTAGCSDTAGVLPLGHATGTAPVSSTYANNDQVYVSFVWAVPMLAKRASISVQTAYAGGTPVSNAYVRLYDIATTGRPGKLLYDFGLLGSANASMNATGIVSTGASGSGFFMLPGDYYMALCVSKSGGTGGPAVYTAQSLTTNRVGSSSCALGGFGPMIALSASAAVSSTPNDPASMIALSVESAKGFSFALKDS